MNKDKDGYTTFSKEDWIKRGTELYGEDRDNWEFYCWFCKKVQSLKSIRENQDKGLLSMRYGKLMKGDNVSPEQCCYSPDCDYVSNGLLTTGILVIYDPDLPHNASLKKNCTFVLPFAKDA